VGKDVEEISTNDVTPLCLRGAEIGVTHSDDAKIRNQDQIKSRNRFKDKPVVRLNKILRVILLYCR
jgi:hypothetical protein